MSIGLPYARVEFTEAGKPVQVCPECGHGCPMTTDADGEQVGPSSYAAHFPAVHGGAA